LAPRVRPPAAPPRTPGVLRLTRHVIPALIVLAGIVSMAIGTSTSLIGGGALIGAGAASWLISWLYRVGVEGDRAREREERTRGYFERHGRWPES
ncbi:MAG: hypothetical protein ACRDLP_01165, partial [Solirubrobacteraceae bacterium]